MMEAARTSETSVYNYFTRQYIPEDKCEHHLSFERHVLEKLPQDTEGWTAKFSPGLDAETLREAR
jgi:hypothetical protein